MRRRRPGPAHDLVAARKAFGELLQWHLRCGTRPPGTPSINRRPWLQTEFADAVRGINIRGSSADKTVRNWCSGRVAPQALRPIEVALFGPEPEDASDYHADFRHRLRLAFQRAKGGAEPISLDAHRRPALPASCTDPGRCFGRDLEVDRLAEAILAGPEGGSVLILGNGGHGKTMLSRTAAMRRDITERFGARRWFVELERSESAEASLAEIAQIIGLTRTARWPDVRVALEDRQQGNRQLPGLLLLDNLETPLHAARQRLPIEQLLRNLLAVPGLSVVATLRSQETIGAVPWREVMAVEPLAPEPAKAMFLSIARTISVDDPDLDFFLGDKGELGGIPLAVHLVAHRVFRGTTLAPLKREWLERGALVATIGGSDDARNDSLVASVEFSLRSKRLKAEGKLLFSLLGQLPAGLSEADGESLIGPESREGAAQLRSVGLLRDNGEARIGLLPPIRDVASRAHPPNSELTASWTLYFLDLLKAEGADLGREAGKPALPRLVQEMPNIAAAVLAAARSQAGTEQATKALRLFENAMTYTGFGGEAALEDLMTAFDEAGDRIGQGRCLFIIGDKARLAGQNEKAKAAFLKALDCLNNTQEDRDAGLCYWGLAEIAAIKGEHEICKGLYQQARGLFKRAGWRPGEADCISGLATVADQADDYAAAMALYAEASQIYKKAGSVRSYADCLWYMAQMEMIRERCEQARRLFETALETHTSVGHLGGRADCLRGLAQLALMRGELDLANVLLDQARQASGPDAVAENDFLLGMAEVARHRGEIEQAENLYRQALAFFRSSEFVRRQADALLGLGKNAQARGDISVARGLYQEGLDLYRRLEGLIGPAHCISALADIEQASNQAEARRLNALALELYSQASAEVGAKRCQAKERLLAASKLEDQASARCL